MPKRTHQPKNGRKHRKMGFRARSASDSGRKVLGARRAKGRHTIAL